jgi:hypothetical protein
MVATLRRALRRWFEPGHPPVPPSSPPSLPAGVAPRPGQEPHRWYPSSPEPYPVTPVEPWTLICEQIALRVLAAAYQMGAEVENAETDEQDPARLEQLYRIDHAVTRVRRQAEILQVLTGRPVEDARRQITTLLDVVRAGSSATEYFQRIHIGHTADLAVVEFAADDLIRILTELLDNATRFSPPAATVTVSAHLTEAGSVLIRVEDGGVGVAPEQLRTLNRMLSGDRIPLSGQAGELQFGLQVVARLAAAHRLGVTLIARPSGGITATVLVPQPLICEVPPPPGGSTTRSRRPGSHRAPAQPTGLSFALPTNGRFDDWRPPERRADEEGELTGKGLPRRVTSSVRGTSPGAILGSPLVPDPAPPFAPPNAGANRPPDPMLPGPVPRSPGTSGPGTSGSGTSGPGMSGATRPGAALPTRAPASPGATAAGSPEFGAPGSGARAAEVPGSGGLPREMPAGVVDGGRTAWHDEIAGFAAGFAAWAEPPSSPPAPALPPAPLPPAPLPSASPWESAPVIGGAIGAELESLPRTAMPMPERSMIEDSEEEPQ